MNMELATPQGRMQTVPHYQEAIASLQQRRDLVLQMMGSVLKEGVHYGKIPGCGDKPSLFLPGAEQLSSSFNFSPRYRKNITREGMHMIADITCELCLPDGTLVAEGVSMCSTYESKYRYRKAERLCPSCGKPTIINGKEEYGGGYVCFAKKGGCGAKFKKGDKSIEEQVVGQSENPDLADQWNTVIKMGAKRSFVHAVRTATGTADVFTQDIEDFRDSYGTVVDADVVIPEPDQRTENRPAPVTVVNGWSEEAQGRYSDLLDTQLYNIYKAGGHPELFSAEQDKWRAAKKTDPADKVLANLSKRVETLKDGAEKAKEKANVKSKSIASPAPADIPPMADDDPGPQGPQGAPGPEMTPEEFSKHASASLKAACERFLHAYTIQNVEDPAKYVKEMRDKVASELKFEGSETMDQKKMKLAEAMITRADKLKIP
jgi:hypothetical protein